MEPALFNARATRCSGYATAAGVWALLRLWRFSLSSGRSRFGESGLSAANHRRDAIVSEGGRCWLAPTRGAWFSVPFGWGGAQWAARPPPIAWRLALSAWVEVRRLRLPSLE